MRHELRDGGGGDDGDGRGRGGVRGWVQKLSSLVQGFFAVSFHFLYLEISNKIKERGKGEVSER